MMIEPATSFDQKQIDSFLLAVAQGDRSALEKLYHKTNAKLFGVCLRISKDEEASKELLQECYIKIWRRAGSYSSGQGSPMSWLIAIARNTAIDWRRAQPSLPTLGDDVLESFEDESVDITGDIDAERAAEDLRFCLTKIDGKYGPAIRSTYLDGLTYAELATQLGKPLGTIKSWIRRGLGQLKACINRRRRGMAS